MKVLLDENLPQRLRHGLMGHEAITVGYLGWDGLKNGDLLRAAESDGFQVVVTGDQKLRYQQNLKSRKIALVVLTAIQWRFIKSHLAEISATIDASVAGSFRVIACDSDIKPQMEDFDGSL